MSPASESGQSPFTNSIEIVMVGAIKPATAVAWQTTALDRDRPQPVGGQSAMGRPRSGVVRRHAAPGPSSTPQCPSCAMRPQSIGVGKLWHNVEKGLAKGRKGRPMRRFSPPIRSICALSPCHFRHVRCDCRVSRAITTYPAHSYGPQSQDLSHNRAGHGGHRGVSVAPSTPLY